MWIFGDYIAAHGTQQHMYGMRNEMELDELLPAHLLRHTTDNVQQHRFNVAARRQERRICAIERRENQLSTAASQSYLEKKAFESGHI